MNVTGAKKHISMRISSSLEYVVDPDHPCLLSGPDILVSDKRSLGGIFLIHATELINPDYLLTRLALSRLAYPNNFSAILVFFRKHSSKAPKRTIREYEMNFDTVVEMKDIKDLGKIISRNLPENKQKDLSHIRGSNYKRSIVYYETSLEEELRSTKSDVASTKIAPLDMDRTLINPRPWLSGAIANSKKPRMIEVFYYHDFRLISEVAETIRDPRRTIKNYSRIIVQNNFSLDFGVPYGSFEQNNIMLLNSPPEYRGDPKKYTRSAAFSGFSLIPEQTKPDLKELIFKLGRRLEN